MIDQAAARLREFVHTGKATGQSIYFKNCAEDEFLGVTTPVVRRIAREFRDLPLEDCARLMHSRVHEERSLAHAILRLQMEKAEPRRQAAIYRLYMANRGAIHDWDGVDDSAPYIAGRFLLQRDRKVLYRLIRARSLWDRRIALVATLWFIRNGQTLDTFALCERVLEDKEDLIHKAAGWMLREAGKRDGRALRRFLKKNGARMSRTMLRYAIERFPEEERQAFLKIRPLPAPLKTRLRG